MVRASAHATCTLILTAVAVRAAVALETDQYWTWGRPLADSTAAVNAKFNLELERTLESLPEARPPERCDRVAAAFRSRLRFILMHDIQIWAWHSRWVARIPGDADELREYYDSNLFSKHHPLDPAAWMPFTPTIEVAGVRMGTDKLAHFVSSGWTMYDEYRRRLRRGAPVDEAELDAARRAVLEEGLILGGMTSGILSISDLEAGVAGMSFYLDLCSADDPLLAFDGSRWTATREIDLREYVGPRWDESFQPPVFTRRRWRRVRPILEGYCDRLDDPLVVAQRRAYRDRDRGSVIGEVVAEKVRAGVLDDPESFGIEAVCGVVDPSRLPADPPPPEIETAVPAASDADLVRAIDEEERDRRRFALGLVGARVTYPQVVSASLAVMATSEARGWDCREPCDFRGPFAELEPGLGGGRLSLGWSRVDGATSRSGSWLTAAYFGYAVRLTVLRTWGGSGWLPSGRSYAGLELGVLVAQANLRIGLLHRIDDGEGERWAVTGSFGWGF